MTVQVMNRLTLFRRITVLGCVMTFLALPLVADAADTTPAAKIVEMDIFAGPNGYIRLDPTVTVTYTGANPPACLPPNNYFIIPTNTDMDRAALAQMQVAYALKKPVVLHVAGCNSVNLVDFPVSSGAKTY